MSVVRSNEELNKYAESKAPLESPIFTGSVIVPTPTAGTQAANKDYVDNVAVTQGASTTVKGIVELATNEETAIGTDTLRAITPEGLHYAFNKTGDAPMFACRAWVNFNGTETVAIRASGNVSSITDNGIGHYTVNLTTAMPDVNYALTGLAAVVVSTGAVLDGSNTFARTTSTFRIFTTTGGEAAQGDAEYVNVLVIR